ncbi:unnamed protein product, partial [Amoebophrya sp. A25]
MTFFLVRPWPNKFPERKRKNMLPSKAPNHRMSPCWHFSRISTALSTPLTKAAFRQLSSLAVQSRSIPVEGVSANRAHTDAEYQSSLRALARHDEISDVSVANPAFPDKRHREHVLRMLKESKNG